MPVTTLFTLEANNITVSGGGSLSGVTQGDGSHLVNRTITLNSTDYVAVDIDDNDANFEDNDGSQRLVGVTEYNGLTLGANTNVEAEYTLTLQDPDGNTYTVIGFNVIEPGGGSPFGSIEGLAFVGPVGGFPPDGVPLTVIGASEGPRGGTTPFDSFATPPCFTPGTMIETARGLVAVEELCVGDLVATLDDGLQPVRWIGQTTIARRDLAQHERLRPVFIGKGALGGGAPVRDMRVSPMHRVLWSGVRAELLFGSDEVLLPAGHLVGQCGITRSLPYGPVTYIHLAFDVHQIILSDGAWTESFLPGHQALSGFDADVRAEIEALFGEFCSQAARPCLKSYEAEVLFSA